MTHFERFFLKLLAPEFEECKIEIEARVSDTPNSIKIYDLI
jgi:hypothetical protein